mgnify:CR=1 FL=1
MEMDRVVAIVGVGTILPDAPDTAAFWTNLKAGRYSISDVTDRWDAALYWDPDPKAPDKTYSKIGGWVRFYPWEPTAWRLPIPPRVAAQMDLAQRWSIAACRDPRDDKFLEVAVNGGAGYIVTGDDDLLVLDPFRGIRILTPQAFVGALQQT